MDQNQRIKDITNKLNSAFKKAGISFNLLEVPVINENIIKFSLKVNGNNIFLDVDSKGIVSFKDFTSSTPIGNIDSPSELSIGLKKEFEKKDIEEESSTGTGA